MVIISHSQIYKTNNYLNKFFQNFENKIQNFILRDGFSKSLEDLYQYVWYISEFELYLYLGKKY